VETPEDYGIVGHSLAEESVIRVAIRPGTLVPTPADDPLTRLDFGRPRRHTLHHLRFGGYVHEVDPFEVGTQTRDVRVRVHEARQDR